MPVARRIETFVSDRWGREFFMYFVLAVFAMTFGYLLYFLIIRLKVKSVSNFIWLVIIAGLYTYFTFKLRNVPVEAIHFLEYGLLGFFLFRALSQHIKDKSIYLTATLLALLIGTFDEILQWITPERYWQFRDVGLNVLSGGLFQLGIWKVINPSIISGKINPKSLRIFSSIFVSCLMILGLCVSNTPDRMYNYTRKIPWLSFLRKEEPMSEFGYKYKDPEIGAFYSRLSPNSLQKSDSLRGDKYAQILNESVDKDYGQFLREYNPMTDPLMHELRVHIFRRDTYFKDGKSASNQSKKKESFLIAYKENLILEKYFGHSIEKSVYRWNEDVLQELETSIDKRKHYDSPVSANLFTSFSEKNIWFFILVLISSLAFINLAFLIFEKRHKVVNP